MTGGDLMFSDNFLKLNDAGRKILKDALALPSLDEAARPLDLFSAPAGKIPSVWFAPGAGKAAVFNWGEEPAQFELGADLFGGRRPGDFFWNRKEAERGPDGSLRIVLAPHEAVGIEIL